MSPADFILTWIGLHAVRAAVRTTGVLGRVQTTRRALWLTFDDGPNHATPAALEALAAAGVQATFFLSGEAARRQPDVVARIREDGHGIGAHGMHHVDAWRAPRKALADLQDGCAALEDLLGQPVPLVRPPYGRFSPATLRWVRATGRRLTLWDVDARDYRRHAEAAEVRRRVRRGVRPGSLVLLHEAGPAWSDGQSLPLLLGDLAADGWSMDALPRAALPRAAP